MDYYFYQSSWLILETKMNRILELALHEPCQINPKEVLTCLSKWHGDPNAVQLARTALELYRLLHSTNHELAGVCRTIVLGEAGQLKESINRFLRLLNDELTPGETSGQNTGSYHLVKIPDNIKTYLVEILTSCSNILVRDMLEICSKLNENHQQRVRLVELSVNTYRKEAPSSQSSSKCGEVARKLIDQAITYFKELSLNLQNLALIGRFLTQLAPVASVDFVDQVLKMFSNNPLISFQHGTFLTVSEQTESEANRINRIFGDFVNTVDRYLKQLEIHHSVGFDDLGSNTTVSGTKELTIAAAKELKEVLIKIKDNKTTRSETSNPQLTVETDAVIPYPVAQNLVATLRSAGEKRIHNLQPARRHLFLGFDGQTHEIISHKNQPITVNCEITKSLTPPHASIRKVVATFHPLTENEIFELFTKLITEHVFKNPEGVNTSSHQMVRLENGIELTIQTQAVENGVKIHLSSGIVSGIFDFARIGEAWALKHHQIEIIAPALFLHVSASQLSDYQRRRIQERLKQIGIIIPVQTYNGLRVFNAPSYILLDHKSYLELVRANCGGSGETIYGYQFCSVEGVETRPEYARSGHTGLLDATTRSPVAGNEEVLDLQDLPEGISHIVAVALVNTARTIAEKPYFNSDYGTAETFTNPRRLLEDFRRQSVSETDFARLMAVTPSKLVLLSDVFAQYPVSTLKGFILSLVGLAEDSLLKGAYYETSPLGKGSAKTVVITVIKLNSTHYVARYYPKFSKNPPYLVIPVDLISELEKQFVAWLKEEKARLATCQANTDFRIDFHEWRQVFGDNFTLEFLKYIPKEAELQELWNSGIRKIEFEFRGQTFTATLKLTYRNKVKREGNTKSDQVVKAFINLDGWQKLVNLYRSTNASEL